MLTLYEFRVILDKYGKCDLDSPMLSIYQYHKYCVFPMGFER